MLVDTWINLDGAMEMNRKEYIVEQNQYGTIQTIVESSLTIVQLKFKKRIITWRIKEGKS